MKLERLVSDRSQDSHSSFYSSLHARDGRGTENCATPAGPYNGYRIEEDLATSETQASVCSPRRCLLLPAKGCGHKTVTVW